MHLVSPTVLALTGAALAGAAFLASSGLCARAVRRRFPFTAVDFPGGTNAYRAAVPLGGGLAVYLATVAVLALGAAVCAVGRPWLPGGLAVYVDGLWYRAGGLAVALGAATLVLVAGRLADLFDLGVRWRLAAQVAAAAAFAAFGERVTLFRPLSHPLVGGAVTVAWLVVLTNAFTFLDNMDGLAAGVGLVASLTFAASQAQAGSLFAPAVLLVLAGALGGFLRYNRYPARLFLGTDGGDFLGFVLGAMTVAGTYYRYGRGDSPGNVLAPVLVMAVPLYEASVVFLIWLRERNSPFPREYHHFSYRLQPVGLSPDRSVRLLLLVTLGSGLGALVLGRVDGPGAALVVAQVGCLVGVAALVESSAIRRGAPAWDPRPARPDPAEGARHGAPPGPRPAR